MSVEINITGVQSGGVLTAGMVLELAQVVAPVFQFKPYKQSDRRGSVTTYHYVANGPRKKVVVFTEAQTVLSEIDVTKANPLRVQVTMITEDDTRTTALGMAGVLSILGVEFFIQEREGILGELGEVETPREFLARVSGYGL